MPSFLVLTPPILKGELMCLWRTSFWEAGMGLKGWSPNFEWLWTDHFSGTVVFLCLKGSWNLRGWGGLLPWIQEEKEAAEEGNERVVVSGRCPSGSLFPQMLHSCKLPTGLLYSWEIEPQHGGACVNLGGAIFITLFPGFASSCRVVSPSMHERHITLTGSAVDLSANLCCNCVSCIRYCKSVLQLCAVH